MATTRPMTKVWTPPPPHPNLKFPHPSLPCPVMLRTCDYGSLLRRGSRPPYPNKTSNTSKNRKRAEEPPCDTKTQRGLWESWERLRLCMSTWLARVADNQTSDCFWNTLNLSQFIANLCRHASKLVARKSMVTRKWAIIASHTRDRYPLRGLLYTLWHEMFKVVYFCGSVIFCVSQELLLVIRTDLFFLLGINFGDFQKVPSQPRDKGP